MSVGFKQATVASGDVPSTQSNFPVYVDLKRMNGGTSLSSADAASIRVYSSSAKTTEWAREIVSVDEMHVKIPSLTSTTSIFVDWDGSRSDYAATDTYGRNAVWGDYRVVAHMGAAVDSTGNNTISAVNSPTTISGKLGGAYGLNGSTQYINLSTLGDFGSTVTAFTISKWMRTTQTARSIDGSLNSGTTTAYLPFYSNANNSEYSFFRAEDGNARVIANSGTQNTIQNGNWNFHVATVQFNSADNMGGFINASSIKSSSPVSSATTYADLTNPYLAGAWNNGGTVTEYLNGDIDEYRIRESVVSADWITTEYNNQNDESGFWGTWSDVGGATDTTKFFAMM